MAKQIVRPSFLKYVYTHNPFYAISAVLMLYAIWTAYRIRGVDATNCGLMIGALAGYTFMLAVIGVWIVRWGKVWEDARSILLLLLVLFLAVSISTDDLFVKAETSRDATILLLSGFLFSAIVSEVVLRGAGVRLGARYRIPYHLMLALFYVAPWFYSPELHPRLGGTLNLLLLLFPVVVSVLFLSLLPAVHGGTAYVDGNGTPWPWPWFPGTAFGVIAGAVSLRSYTLTMTFGVGPVWIDAPGSRAIEFDTIWGPYFLIPLALAILILLFEIGLVTANRKIVLQTLRAAPLLLLLAVPWGNGAVFRGFLQRVVDTVGSPLWLTTWLMIAFYGWAWLRGAQEAGRHVLLAGALLSVVGSRTVDIHSFAGPQPWPILVVGCVLFVRGLWARSSRVCTMGIAVVTLGLWYLLPQTALSAYRMTICCNAAWFAILVLGLTFRDPFARVLRVFGAFMFPAATLLTIAGNPAADIPILWRVSYIVLLAVACLLIARVWRNLWFLYAFGGMVGLPAYVGVVRLFHRAADVIGRDAITAFVWSLGTLLLAFLISARKARWLPQKLWPSWNNGNGIGMVHQSDHTKSANG